jgi:hypothetical protein
VRACVSAAFPGYTQYFESLTPFLYPDLKGIITFDAGIVCTRGMALSIQWTKPDGSLASHDDIEAAYDAVSSPAALASDQQGGGHYASFTSIRATPASLASAFAAPVARFEGQLRGLLSNWDVAPANAQLAAMSHAWAFGGLFPLTWPSWTKFFVSGDYAGASCQDMPSAREWALQNDSFHRRIKLEQSLLANALQGDPDQLLGWPLP